MMRTSITKRPLHKTILLVALLATGSVVLDSCMGDPNSPGVEYMPDMYRSTAIEAYTPNQITDSNSMYTAVLSARKPVEGTIPRGYMPYPYPNTADGYKMAGEHLKNPLPYSEATVEEAKEIYTKFCVHCHGEKGAGDGKVAQNPKWPGPPPAYNSTALANLPEGQIFHSIHYGKGLMGSHASQISQEDRWKLVYYVQTLQGKDLSAPSTDAAEPEAPADAADAETADATATE